MSASAFKIQVVDEDETKEPTPLPKKEEVENIKPVEKTVIKAVKKTATKTKATEKKTAKKPAKKVTAVKKVKKTSKKEEVVEPKQETLVDNASTNTVDLSKNDKPVSDIPNVAPIAEPTVVDATKTNITPNEPVTTPATSPTSSSPVTDVISQLLSQENQEIAPKKSSFFSKISGVISKNPAKEEIIRKAEIVNNEISGNATPEVKTEQTAPEGNQVKNLIAQLEVDREKKEENIVVPELENTNIHVGRSVRIYRKIAYFFFFLVLILVGFISYYTFVKVKIVIIPNQERISNNMIFDIKDQELQTNESGNTIAGIVKKVEVESTKKVNSSGTEVIGKDVAGMATIYNNYTKNQPLVATTRLLSADNKLFRTRNTVNVPAGGSVEVEIYADEPGPDSAIGPTKLSLPGLWAGLQDKIFAETKESIDYKQKVKKYIVQTDIDDGIRDLKQQLLTDAKSQINEKYKEYGEIIYKINENSVKSVPDKKVNDEVDDFNITMTAEVIVVAFDEKKTANLAKQKFLSSLSENKELISFDDQNIIYTLSNYDSNQGSATVNATFEGKISVKDNVDVIEVDKIVGLNNEQLEVYLKNITEIAGYEIKYTPTFLKRVPNLVDRITIEIKK